MVGQIRITQQNARIEFSSQNISLDTRQPLPEMVCSKTKGSTDVQSQPPQLQLDQTECFAEEGLKTVFRLTADFARDGLSDAREYVEKTGEQSHQLLENALFDKSVFAKFAKQQVVKQYTPSTVTFIPSQPPQMSFTDNVYHYDITPDKLNLDWNVTDTPEITVAREPGVKISMAQYPEFHMQYLENPSLLDIMA